MLLKIKDALRSVPVPVSERSFRLAARRLSKNVLSGRQMMVRSDDIEAILREMTECRTREASKRRAAAKRNANVAKGVASICT